MLANKLLDFGGIERGNEGTGAIMDQTHENRNALKEYEQKQAEIAKLLKQILDGMQKHDRNASGQGGHHWGHVGDLTSIASTLTDIRDRLHNTGEYAKG